MTSDSPTPEEPNTARALLRRNDVIEELEFSQRLVHAYNKVGIKTIGDLVTKTEYELTANPGIGEAFIRETEEVLGLEGLSLGMQLPGEPA